MNAEYEIEILLVEDSPYDAELTIRELTRRHLANKLVHLKDGAEALDFIFGTGGYANRDTSQHPKVVLLDLKLPHKMGLDVLEWIRQQPAVKSVVVIILSSSVHEGDLRRAYELGANAFLVKPSDSNTMAEMCKALNHFWLTFNRTPTDFLEP